MRRVVLSVTVLVALVGGTTSAASAADPNSSPAPVVGPATKGKKVCSLADDRLTEISGMAATSSGYAVVNNGSGLDSHRKIFLLDSKCAVSKAVTFSGNGARDPEDLAAAKDGTLWVADTGDSAKNRETIALWKLAKGSNTPVVYRLSYPDGKHDAGALILAADGTPVIVTKDAAAPKLYSPVGALQANKTVKLQKVGTFSLPKTTTSNPLAAAGRLVVTGGAVSPNGSKVTLRTYSDAVEFDVTNGNLVESIVKGVPRVTPLPDEPRGEAITYSTDGAAFLTVSETAQATDGTKPTILRYTPAVASATKSPTTVKEGAVSKSSGPSWFNKLSLTDITYIIGVVGVIGLLLVGVGVFGILRARRRPPEEDAAAKSGSGAESSGGAAAGGRADERPTATITPVREEPPYGRDPSVWDRPAGYDEYASPASGQGGYQGQQQYAGAGGSAGSGGTYRSSGASNAPGQAGTRGPGGPASSGGSRGSGGEYRSGGHGATGDSGGTYRSGGAAGAGGSARQATSGGSRGPAGPGGEYHSGGSYRSDSESFPSGVDYQSGTPGRQYQPAGRGADRPTGYPDRGGVYGEGSAGGAVYGQEEPHTGNGYRQRGSSSDYDYADPDPRARY
jgi:hypothetical protein